MASLLYMLEKLACSLEMSRPLLTVHTGEQIKIQNRRYERRKPDWVDIPAQFFKEQTTFHKFLCMMYYMYKNRHSQLWYSFVHKEWAIKDSVSAHISACPFICTNQCIFAFPNGFRCICCAKTFWYFLLHVYFPFDF